MKRALSSKCRTLPKLLSHPPIKYFGIVLVDQDLSLRLPSIRSRGINVALPPLIYRSTQPVGLVSTVLQYSAEDVLDE
jgi:hypothetical protein